MEEFEISSISYGGSDLKQAGGGLSQGVQQQQALQQQQSQLSQYGFQQQQQQHPFQQQQQVYQTSNYPLNQQHPFQQQQQPQQPTHTNSTSSSASSIVTTPGNGVSDIPTMTGTNTTAAAATTATGVSPGSTSTTTGIVGGGQNSVVNNIHKPIDADSGYCIDWCPNRTSTAMMVVGLGKEIGARVSFLLCVYI